MPDCFQIASGLLFQKDADKNRPPDQVIEGTTRRLGQISVDAVVASRAATEAAELPELKVASARAALGVLSVRLDNLGENAAHILRDWQFHPAAVADPVPPQPSLNPAAQSDPNGGTSSDDQS